MCGLCGALGAAGHWTDASQRPQAFAGRPERPLRQERYERIALLNQLLRPYRLQLRDHQGSAYLLRSATGRQAVLRELCALWPEAERLSGRRCDPLDPAFIAALAPAEG